MTHPHSPLPWTVNKAGDIIDANGERVIADDGAVWPEDRDYIVLSATAHEKMRKALEEVKPLLWCCHVRGPDDVHAAPDYETALKWSDMVNEWSAKTNEGVKQEDQVWAKAAPALWPWSPENHAEALPKSIAEFAPRAALAEE
jgi:hypothetical protein